ncbi:MAG: tetratricopeptide repeat protein [Candidatus Hodarchaeota archaeon]
MPISSKKDEKQTHSQITELKLVEQLIRRGKLNEALHEIHQLEREEKLKDNGRVQIQILKSRISTHLGKGKAGLKYAEQALIESKRIGSPLLTVDSFISKAMALLELRELNKCFKVLQDAEAQLLKIKDLQEADFANREATLNHLKGRIFSRKSDLNSALEHLQRSVSIRQEYGDSYGLADSLNVIGIIYSMKGDFDSALTNLQQSLAIFEEFGNKHPIVKILNNLGMIYWQTGELNQALGHYCRALELSQELDNKRYIATLSSNIGLISWHKGELDSALRFYQKALNVFEELESKSEKAACLTNIGIVYKMRGELDRALQFYEKSLKIREELENKQEIANILNNMGLVYYLVGELQAALAFFKKSLLLFEEIGNNVFTSLPLFSLIYIAVESKSVEQAKFYLQKLQELNEKEENKRISQRYRVAKAIVLKTSDRVIQRGEAQQLLQQVINEEINEFELTVDAMLGLCELLLLELKTSGSVEVLEEVKTLITNLLEIAKAQNSHVWLTKSYWLQSKLALMELDLETAQQLLVQAQKIAENKGFQVLVTMISNEYGSLIGQISKWQKFVEEKPPINEIIELTQLEELLERMIYKKLYRTEEEVEDYAKKALALMEKWEQIDEEEV